MLKWVLICLLFAAPLAAARESNFGRVILDHCDIIVQGVASAKRTKIGAAVRVEVSIENVLYGKEANSDVSVFLSDPKSLIDGASRALFALDRLADGGYNLVGKPVLTPHGDAEGKDKLSVLDDFIKLEEQKEGDKRTEHFWKILNQHVAKGGYASQNAAVELMFIARDQRSIITIERFNQIIATRDGATNRLTKETKSDLKLAFQGLVEAKVKNLKFKEVRRAETKQAKRKAARELNNLQITYPRAFVDDDAKLCDALAKSTKDSLLEDSLIELARNVRASVRARARDQAKKDAEAKRKIDHAGK